MTDRSKPKLFHLSQEKISNLADVLTISSRPPGTLKRSSVACLPKFEFFAVCDGEGFMQDQGSEPMASRVATVLLLLPHLQWTIVLKNIDV